jgi:hemin uptake protein HemP
MRSADAENSVTMLELVKPEHRINSEQLFEQINKLLAIENRV